jgi:hypothetical protein
MTTRVGWATTLGDDRHIEDFRQREDPLAFDSAVADGSGAPQFAWTGGAPAGCTSPAAGFANLNATNIFQGLLGCLPPSFGYLPNEQRFNAFLPNSIFVNNNYLSAGLPLAILPFGFPTAKKFEYAYSQQANLGIEHDFGHDVALNVSYNFNGGHHLNRPMDVNPPVYEALIANWRAAMSDPALQRHERQGSPAIRSWSISSASVRHRDRMCRQQ